MTTEGSRLRIAVLGVVALSLFSTLFARLGYLQIAAADRYAVQAEGNRVRIVLHEAPRGRLLDRRGRVLVDNRVSNVVTISRLLLGTKLDDVVKKLAPVLGMSEEAIRARINDPRLDPHHPIPVASDVSKEVVVYLREHADEFPSVKTELLPVRVYPQGTLAAHVLGYIGEINDEELKARKREGYRPGDLIGKTGAERAYEADLRGTPGIEKLEVNSKGDVLRSLGFQPPQQGHDVQLTIDLDIQAAAEQALAKGVQNARARHNPATGGAVVVLDPRDGSVLAMASYPTFDPSAFVHGITSDVWRTLNDPANNFPLTNRAIQAQYAPGSTFKPVTAIAALSSGIVSPSTTIRDEGSVQIGNRLFRNFEGKAQGIVDLRRAITVSSDVYFYTLGYRIYGLAGDASLAIQRTARQLGFDQSTGIELPFEQSGRVPDPAWKRRVHQRNPQGFPEGNWYAGDNVNLAIGQGDLLATPLQMADAYGALANGGTVFTPHLGARVIDRFGSVVRQVQAVPRSQVAIDPAYRAAILQGMEGVVAAKDGTASGAFAGFPLGRWPVGGKTGTAQVAGKQDSSLFGAIMPVNDPRYVVYSVVEQAGQGADVAAPIARDILERVVALEQSPDLPPAVPPASAAPQPGAPAITPSSTGPGQPAALPLPDAVLGEERRG